MKCITSTKHRTNKERKIDDLRLVDEDWSYISDESTARGIPSLLRVHDCGSDPSGLNIKARRTKETVWI